MFVTFVDTCPEHVKRGSICRRIWSSDNSEKRGLAILYNQEFDRKKTGARHITVFPEVI